MKIDNRPTSVVRISPEVYDKLKLLSETTGGSVGEIASDALRYALDNCYIESVCRVRFGNRKENHT